MRKKGFVDAEIGRLWTSLEELSIEIGQIKFEIKRLKEKL
jgi:hypothetical protein